MILPDDLTYVHPADATLESGERMHGATQPLIPGIGNGFTFQLFPGSHCTMVYPEKVYRLVFLFSMARAGPASETGE